MWRKCHLMWLRFHLKRMLIKELDQQTLGEISFTLVSIPSLEEGHICLLSSLTYSSLPYPYPTYHSSIPLTTYPYSAMSAYPLLYSIPYNFSFSALSHTRPYFRFSPSPLSHFMTHGKGSSSRPNNKQNYDGVKERDKMRKREG